MKGTFFLIGHLFALLSSLGATELRFAKIFTDRYLAERIEKAAGPKLKKQVDLAFRLVFNRQPNKEEMEISKSVLEEENLFVLCRSLINSNEFFYFD